MKKKYVMFIDETGIPDIKTKDQPFTLTGVIFENKYAIDENQRVSKLTQEINQYKMACFNRLDLPLHLDHISRGKKGYTNIPRQQRENFYLNLPNFLSGLDFKIISVTIDKDKLEKYYEPSKDPYVIAFTHLLKTFYTFIGSSKVETARIICESRDDNQNLQVQKAFFDVFNNGTIHLNIETHREKIKGFVIAKKDDSMYKSGLEIADLVCNPLSRVRRGLIEANPKCMNNYGNENKIFKAIKDKIYTATDLEDIRNWGFKKIPILKKKRAWNDDSYPASS